MFNATPAQQKAIDTRGNVLVTAAAGSGKTAVLVERVIKMLTDGESPLSVERLLIVTFTNAAAAEMRGRIERRLTEEQRKNPTDRNLRRQLLMLPSAQICTIDTFCINLVRENFEHFDISPDFKIVTDGELAPLYEEAMKSVLDVYYAEHFDLLSGLMTALGCAGNERKLTDAVRKIFDFSTSMPFPAHWFAACKKMYEDENTELWQKAGAEFAMEERDGESIRAEAELAAGYATVLLEICERFSEKLYSLLRENNTFTFFNTEQMALELLCNADKDGYTISSRARDISALYDEILVDEYQDVNDLQDTLFYIISDCGKKLFAVGDAKQSIYGFRGANPENFVRKKESFVPVDAAEDGDGKKIALSANFRSRKGVCKFVNYIFSLTMSKAFGGVDYDSEEMLISSSSFPENGMFDTYIELIDSSSSEMSDIECEAAHIAAYIRKTVKQEPFLRDGDALRHAKYGDFAILMRSPSGHAEVYAQALRAAGIPVCYDNGTFLESREISTVMSMLRVINNPSHDVPLLALMMSPLFGFSADDVAEIRMYNRHATLYAALLEAEKGGNSHALEFLRTVRRYRRKAVTLSVDRLLSELYSETALLDVFGAMPDGQHRKNNLLLLMDRASEYSENGRGISGFISYIEKTGASLHAVQSLSDDAVKLMSFHGSKGLQFPICIIAGCHSRFNKSDSTASLVMDRHLGIAFKILDTKTNKRINTRMREVISESVARRNISEELRILYVALTRAQEHLVITLASGNHQKKAQSIAKQIASGTDAELIKSAGSFYDWFMYAILKNRQCDGLRELLGVRLEDKCFAPCSECEFSVRLGPADIPISDSEISEIQTADTDCDELLKRMDYKYPNAALTSAPTKISVSDLVKSGKTDSAFKRRPAFASKAGLTPAERGTATHKFMQFAEYLSAFENIDSEILRLEQEEYITHEEAAAINRRELKAFFESDIYSRMSRAVLHREMRFITEVSIEEIGFFGNGKTVMQGVIDCVIDEGDSVSVIDFKTDRVGDGQELVERYGKQLEIYARACERLFSLPVKDKFLYSFALGKTVKL